MSSPVLRIVQWSLVLKVGTSQFPFLFAEKSTAAGRLDGEKDISGLSPGQFVTA